MRRSLSCTHYTTGIGVCGSIVDVRHYLIGDRCPFHTPARLAGREENRPDPALSLTGRKAHVEVEAPIPAKPKPVVPVRSSTSDAYREARQGLAGARRRRL